LPIPLFISVSPVVRRRGKRGEWLQPKATRASSALKDGLDVDALLVRIAGVDRNLVGRLRYCRARAHRRHDRRLVGVSAILVGVGV
jgi:hypothetical protein